MSKFNVNAGNDIPMGSDNQSPEDKFLTSQQIIDILDNAKAPEGGFTILFKIEGIPTSVYLYLLEQKPSRAIVISQYAAIPGSPSELARYMHRTSGRYPVFEHHSESGLTHMYRATSVVASYTTLYINLEEIMQ